jgi:uncharacterized protein (DUF1330 family)
MIARVWRGWTSPDSADAYERLLREQVMVGLQGLDEHQGGYILRQDHADAHDGGDEGEFLVVNFFESLDAVRAFAGEEYTMPVFEREARRLLARIEPIARH